MLSVFDGQNFDWRNIPLADCLKGNAMDAYYTLKVYTKLLEKVEALGLVKLYEKLIAPLSLAFRDMEYEGLLIDQKVLAKLKVDISTRIVELEAQLKGSPGVPLDANLSSSEDLIKILFSLEKDKGEWIINESVGFGLYPPVRTDKGQPSTDEETLTMIKTLIDEEVVKRGLHVKEAE